MPFTFSHPAIVLPFTFLPKKWFSLTGLIIGSLTPDFEYFVRMKLQSNYSHTIAGVFWFDLPLGIMLVFIFHNIVRDSIFDNLPLPLKSRFMAFKWFDWNKYFIGNWYVVVVSLVIGAFSHILWDSFTHEHGYFVEVLPVLSKSVILYGKEIPILKVLQHSSTLIGGLVIIMVIYRLPVQGNTIARLNVKYWTILVAITLIIILFRLLSGVDYRLYGNLIVITISALIISLILTPVVLMKQNK